MGTHRIRFSSISRVSLPARNSYTFLQAFDLQSTCSTRYSSSERQKTPQAPSSRRHPIWSALHRGPCRCDRDSRARIRTSSHHHLLPNRKTHSIHDLHRYPWFGSHSMANGPVRTVPLYLENTAYSISPSAATADLWNTVRDSLSSLSRGRCSRMLLKVMPFVFRSNSVSFQSHVQLPVGRCGSNTARTQRSSPTPTVMSNIQL